MSQTPQNQPQMAVLIQYVKDLSFENPMAPNIFMAQSQTQPQINVDVNVETATLSADTYEITLALTAKATRGADTMFMAEVSYAGVFQIRNIPAEHMEPIMMIECPRLLFPFARNVLADATREGGFPPLLINPVDFQALYVNRKQTAAPSSPVPPARNGGGTPPPPKVTF